MKALNKELFKKGAKFKIRNQYNSEILSDTVYNYQFNNYGDGITVETVDTSNLMNIGGGNIAEITNTTFTVYSYMLEQKVISRVKFKDCVVVEDEKE